MCFQERHVYLTQGQIDGANIGQVDSHKSQHIE